jgi:nucleotide-binding universal stress UspA family protein
MEYRKILMAIDRTSSNSDVLDDALDLAQKQGAQMMFFYCLKQETVAKQEDRIATVAELVEADSLHAFDRQQKGELGHAQAWLETLTGLAEERGIVALAEAETGEPGQRICDLASRWGADVIILGQSSRGLLAECILGSVSSHVVHHAPCSVLLIKRK